MHVMQSLCSARDRLSNERNCINLGLDPEDRLRIQIERQKSVVA